MTSIKCEVCGQHYEVDNVNVIGHHEGMWFMRIQCSACHTQCLVAVVVQEGEEAEVVTDLTEAELARFSDMGMITADDVLNTHNFLKGFGGDISRLFSQE